MGEGARDGDHARVRPNVIIIADRTALIDTCHTRSGSAGSPSSCVTSGNATMLWLPMATPAVPLARMSSHSLSIPSSTSSRHVLNYPASLRKCRACHWVCPRATCCRIHSHNLDSAAEMVTTAASVTVSNVVVGTEAGLSVQNAAMKLQWYGLLPSPHPRPRHPFLHTALTSSTRQTRRPSPKRTYTSSAYDASSRFETASQGTRFPSTTASQSRSPPPDRRTAGARVRASPLNPSTLSASEPARVGLQTVCARVNAVWPALLAALSFLLIANLSDSLFGDVLKAPCTAGCLALSPPRDAFLPALAKAALPPRVVAALD